MTATTTATTTEQHKLKKIHKHVYVVYRDPVTRKPMLKCRCGRWVK